MHLVRNDLYDWVYDPDISTEIALLRLCAEPYNGMLLILGKIDISDSGVEHFEYLVVRNPNDIDFSEDLLFHKYLERVIETALRESKSNEISAEDNETNIPELVRGN